LASEERYTLPPAPDNLYGLFDINVSGMVAPTVSDGYWSFIQGILAPGFYKLQFGGATPINTQGNTFTEVITYHITVTAP